MMLPTTHPRSDGAAGRRALRSVTPKWLITIHAILQYVLTGSVVFYVLQKVIRNFFDIPANYFSDNVSIDTVSIVIGSLIGVIALFIFKRK